MTLKTPLTARFGTAALLTSGLALVASMMPAVASSAAVEPTGQVGHDTSMSAWSTKCGFTQIAQIDPIVHYGENPAGHVHEFFGQPDVTDVTTPETLRADPVATKCKGPVDPRHRTGKTTLQDKSAYWVPALYPTKAKTPGTEIVPELALTYYRNEGVDPLEIQPFPEDLSFVAGNSMATVRQDRTVVQWSCIGSKVGRVADQINFGTTIPASCPAVGVDGVNPYYLRMTVLFPNCLKVGDDQTDDTDRTAYAQPLDHRTNKIKRTCTGYGEGWIAIPQIQVGVRWPITGGEPIKVHGVPSFDLSHFQLASDGMTMDGVTTGRNGMTAHADFMSGWTQSDIDALVLECYTLKQKDCGVVGGGGN